MEGPSRITFLFTDIEGSTRLWDRAPTAMASALSRHDELLGAVVTDRGGSVLKHTGDGMIAVFGDADAAVVAAVGGQRALAAERWPDGVELRVRMAINTGDAERRANDYFGPALNHTARMLDAAHGGQILVSSTSARSVAGLPADVQLLDLGEHRLRDVSEGWVIYQVFAPGLPSQFPPLRTLDRAPNNLPVHLTEFVGRRTQVRQLAADVSSRRLVALTGVGGVGKSRLAVATCVRLLERFPDGVWLVDLSPVADADGAAAAIARTIRVREDSTRSLTDDVIGFLRTRRTLLVLDNCEHLISAVAALTEHLLHSCPELHVLVTTREALGIAGEHIRQVPPLTAPPVDVDLEHLLEYESAALFVDRALAVAPDFAVSEATLAPTIEICRRLDGIPLALELAAARLRVLSVSQIAERLDDRFRLLTGGSRTALPRHRTLEATMDWSHDLLGRDEQVLLRRLSVFQGGFDIDAAEAVAVGDGIDRGDLIDVLAHLADESMLVVEGTDPVRYRMLETVRQYAGGRLVASNDTERTRRRHADWVATMADGAEEGLRSTEQVAWAARLRREQDNIAAAMLWTLDVDPDQGLRIAAGMGRFWYLFGPYAQGERWLHQFLQAASPTPSRTRALALRWRAALLWMQSRLDEGTDVAHQAMAVAREAGEPTIEALAQFVLGFIADSRGDTVGAAKQYRQSWRALETLGERYWATLALSNLATVVRRMGDPEESQHLADTLLEQARSQDDGRLLGLAHSALAMNALHRGDETECRRQLRAGLEELESSGQPVWGALCLINAVYTAAITGFHDLATELVGEMEAETARSGRPEDLRSMHLTLGVDALHRSDWARGERELNRVLELTEEDDGLDRAEALATLGLIALGRNDSASAIEFAERSLDTAEFVGSQAAELSALNVLALAHLAADDAEQAEQFATRAATIAGRTRDMIPLVRSAETLGALAAWRGGRQRAHRLLSSAVAFRHRLHLERSKPEQDRFDTSMRALGETLEATATATAAEAQAPTCESLSELVACCLEPALTGA